MRRYRSVGVALALAALAACTAGGAPHPAGWTQAPGAKATWTTMSGAGSERYSYNAESYSGQLQDLASEQAVDTVQRERGARLIRSVPFPACPGEAGLARYALPGGRLLEVAFTVSNGKAVIAEYLRPASIGEAPAAITAMRQAVCYSL
ncbi:MAG TPA: hypothetical protein VIN40_03760 [Candidatus Tyrphobacter sp.]